jgi:hypothetical protein
MANDGKVKRIDNHRIFRPEAVEAYCTRRAGEPWSARLRGERWIIIALTLVAIAAIGILKP